MIFWTALPANGVISSLRLVGLGQEGLVLHRIHERFSQGRGAILRHAGRRQERPSQRLPREDQRAGLPLLVGLGEVDDQRNVGQVVVLVERELEQHVNAASP